MSSYRSAYEEYYKNINNAGKGKLDKGRYSIFRKKNSNSSGIKRGTNDTEKITNVLVKRIITELTGAAVLLIFFMGLKYSPSEQAKEMHIKCKEALTYNVNYNDYLNNIDTIQIGNVNGGDLKIEADNFVKYLKSRINMSN